MSNKPRKAFDGVGRPKSPLDDAAKWIVKQGGKQLKKTEVQHIKRYARGIGWSKSYEKSGLEKIVDKKVGKRPVANTVEKTRDRKLANAKLNMYYKKQDKFARTYGDTSGPHQRFFSDMDSGHAPRKEFNRRMNAAWNAEVEIGRKYGKSTNKAAARALGPKTKRTKTLKGKK